MGNLSCNKNKTLGFYIEIIKPYLEHPDVMEVCFNEPGVAKLEVAGEEGWLVKQDPLLNYDFWWGFNTIMANARGGSYDEKDNPIVSGELPGGFRWQAFVSPNYVESGFDISIRSPAKCYPLESFGIDGALKEKIIQKIQTGGRVLISGGTSSGKSTLTNGLLRCYPKTMRVQSVEDAHELVIPHEHKTKYFIDRNSKGKAPVGYREIVEHMSRSRPDLIIVGEVSVENTLATIRLFNEGKPAIATIHANSPERAIGNGGALEVNLLIGGYAQGGAQAIIAKFYQDIDVLIQVNSVGMTRQKMVTHVLFPNEGKSYIKDLGDLVVVQETDQFDEAIKSDPDWKLCEQTIN